MVTSSTVSPKNDCNVGTLADAILFKDILWKDELFIDMYLFKENIYTAIIIIIMTHILQ